MEAGNDAGFSVIGGGGRSDQVPRPIRGSSWKKATIGRPSGVNIIPEGLARRTLWFRAIRLLGGRRMLAFLSFPVPGEGRSRATLGSFFPGTVQAIVGSVFAAVEHGRRWVRFSRGVRSVEMLGSFFRVGQSGSFGLGAGGRVNFVFPGGCRDGPRARTAPEVNVGFVFAGRWKRMAEGRHGSRRRIIGRKKMDARKHEGDRIPPSSRPTRACGGG